MKFKEFKSHIFLETIDYNYKKIVTDFFLQLCYNKNDFKKKTYIKLFK